MLPLRSARAASAPSSHLLRHACRHQTRLISFTTPPSQRPRSFKGGLLRWAIAGGALYWYSTRDVDVFAEDARDRLHASKLQQKPLIIETHDETEELPTVDSITSARRKRLAATAAGPAGPAGTLGPASVPEAPVDTPAPIAPANHLSTSSAIEPTEAAPAKAAPTPASAPADSTAPPPPPAAASLDAGTPPPTNATMTTASPASLEEEAQGEGAFNEETGEINWDCPCLGGMAHGPCGEQFREAFSCFVYSTEEPKGVDCIERFKTMQDCFREHPDVYGAELTDDELNESEGPDASANPPPPPPPEQQQQQRSENETSSGGSSVTFPKSQPQSHHQTGRTPEPYATSRNGTEPTAHSRFKEKKPAS